MHEVKKNRPVWILYIFNYYKIRKAVIYFYKKEIFKMTVKNYF